MPTNWFYSHGDGNQVGPVSTAQLKALAASGQLRPSDLVWREGMANWVQASQSKGIFPEASIGSVSPLSPRQAQPLSPPPSHADFVGGPVEKHAGVSTRTKIILAISSVPLIIVMLCCGLGAVLDFAAQPQKPVDPVSNAIHTNKPQGLEGAIGVCDKAAFSSDGHRLLVGNGKGNVRILDWPGGQQRAGHEFNDSVGERIFFVKDRGAALMEVTARGLDGQQFILWDVEAGPEVGRFGPAPLDRFVMSIGISPDGLYALSGHAGGDVFVWDLQTGKQIRRVCEGAKGVFYIVFAPNGKLALACCVNEIVIWEVASWKEVQRLHVMGQFDAKFCADGRTILSGGAGTKEQRGGVSGHELHLLDSQTGKELRRFSGHTNDVLKVNHSPDGTKVVSSSLDGTVRVWDFQIGNELKQFDAGEVTDVLFTPDGRQVLTCSTDSGAHLWSLAD